MLTIRISLIQTCKLFDQTSYLTSEMLYSFPSLDYMTTQINQTYAKLLQWEGQGGCSNKYNYSKEMKVAVKWSIM
jgi:hypothetical protein